MTLVLGDDDKEIDDYVSNSWEYLAGKAWRSFRQHGRGAIQVDLSGALVPSELRKLNTEKSGVAACGWILSEVVTRARSDGWTDFAEMVEQYNPETEIVIVLQFKGGSAAYRLYGTPEGKRQPSELGDYKPPVTRPELLGMGRGH